MNPLSTLKLAELAPRDEHNQALLSQVHPPDWRNPSPASRYNLVVIGGGTAGLVTAAGAAGLGAKVALVERHYLGGDCLNVGCVPSKALLRSAHAAAEQRRAAEFGLRAAADDAVDFSAVMERLRRIRAGLSPHDSAPRFTGLGVDVFLGHARFVDPTTLEVDGTRLRFVKAVIATGARPAVPAVPGLREAGPLTNETVFNLTQRPRRLAVLGGGPIGCELAQAFQRLGSHVVLLHNKGHVLDREDADAAAALMNVLRREGVELLLHARLDRVTAQADGKTLHYHAGGQPGSVTVDALLVAAGRIPNIEDLNLEAVGVAADDRGRVRVDDYLQTTNPRIYACGDVCLNRRFTHAADFSARLVIQNALFRVGPCGGRRWSSLMIPWCTYTDPEIAHVGVFEHDPGAGDRTTFLQPLTEVDRAITDGDREGFVKIHTHRRTGRILGATVVARNAGDLISEISVAMAAKLSLGRLAQVVHPYPTQAEAIRKCGDQYNRARLTPRWKKWFTRWLAWKRGARPEFR